VTLWLVRHARPLAADGLCYGRLDLPVDAGAAQDLARELATQLPLGLVLRTSPSSRCLQLAQLLHQLRPDLPPTSDPRLQELDFGTWEGRTWDAIGPAAVQAWTDAFAQHQPGGGESVATFLRRVGDAFDEAAASTAGQAWITHAGVIRAARLLAAGRREVRSAADWPAGPLPFGHCEPITW